MSHSAHPACFILSETTEHQLVQARLSSDTSSLGSPHVATHHAPSSSPHSPRPPPPSVPIAAGSPSKKMTGARRRMKTNSVNTTPDKKKAPVTVEEEEEEDVEQIDCRHQQRGEASDEGIMNVADESLISRFGAVVGTLILSSINPVRLFGLASGASSFLQSSRPSDHPTSTSQVNPHLIPVSTSSESPAKADGRTDPFVQRAKSADARKMILATEAALLWVDPYRSLRILALCLYLTVCIYRIFAPSLVFSSSPITPSTLMLGLALLYLARNGIKNMANAQQPSGAGSHEEDRSKDEIDVYVNVTRVLEATCSTVIPVVASLASLIHRILSGRKLTSSCVVALSLWVAMVGIEMKALPAAGFYSTSILILATFILPALYVRSREGMDLMVEDSMRLLLRLFLSSSRQTILLSIGTALLVMNRAPLGLILRVTASSIAAVGVLIWRSNPTPANLSSPTA